MELRNAVIVDGVRSPFARAVRGKLVATRLDELGAKVIRHLLDRNPKVEDRMIEDVGLGNVLGNAEFVDLGRVAKMAGLPPEVSKPIEGCAFFPRCPYPKVAKPEGDRPQLVDKGDGHCFADCRFCDSSAPIESVLPRHDPGDLETLRGEGAA